MSRHVVSLSLSDRDLSDLDFMATTFEGNRSEGVRKLLQLVRVLYDEDLTLRDTIRQEYHNEPLPALLDMTMSELMNPVPILYDRILSKKQLTYFE